jgi:hypothetical protein
MILEGMKAEDSELNGSNHSQNLICSEFFCQCNFGERKCFEETHSMQKTPV